MHDHDGLYLSLAARHALRAAGNVEPNPLVGAVIVRDGRILGIGHHRRFGGPHAEVEALASAWRQRHVDLARAAMYITMEPCAHHGKTPPCTQVIVGSGIRTVVIATGDPNPAAAGGAAILREAGLDVRFSDASQLAVEVSRPFIKPTVTGMPWVIAKWAQTIDGRIATRSGESKWISGSLSRRRVHRLRARVDAIVTGLGTVTADDPQLTARDVPRVRRIARRVVVDPNLELPEDAALIQSARQFPLTIACSKEAISAGSGQRKRTLLAEAQVELAPLEPGPGGLDLAQLLRHLATAHGATNVLVESGPVLLGSLLGCDLVDEAVVYIAPLLMADEGAVPPASGCAISQLSSASRFRLLRAKRIDDDIELTYRRMRCT